MSIGFKRDREECEGYLIEADTFVEAAIKAQDFVDALDAALQKKYPGKWKEGDAYIQTVFCGQGVHLATLEAVDELVGSMEYEFD